MKLIYDFRTIGRIEIHKWNPTYFPGTVLNYVRGSFGFERPSFFEPWESRLRLRRIIESRTRRG